MHAIPLDINRSVYHDGMHDARETVFRTKTLRLERKDLQLLQIPDNEGKCRFRHPASQQARHENHMVGTHNAYDKSRRDTTILQCAYGRYERGRAAPAYGKADRGIFETDRRIYGKALRKTRHYRLEPDKRIQRRDQKAGRYGKQSEIRPVVYQ